jgi:hypothetical protein
VGLEAVVSSGLYPPDQEFVPWEELAVDEFVMEHMMNAFPPQKKDSAWLPT